MKLRLRHITTGLQRPSFPSITHADLSPSPISSRKQHLLCTICRTLAVPFTLPFLLSSFLFFLFVFFVSLLLFGILSQHFLYIVLARSSLFFLLFRLVLILSSGSPFRAVPFYFLHALFSVSLRRFVASKIVVKSK